MKLLLNNVDLATLGVLSCLGRVVVREPAEAPQRERVTERYRLDFFENSFSDNAGLVAQVRAALKSQQTQLLWQDDNETNYTNRTVTIADDDEPSDGRAVGGTTRQAITFSFWYLNHDVVTNCLGATLQRAIIPIADDPLAFAANSVPMNLGAVEHWDEENSVEYFDKLRDKEKMLTGSIAASGRWQGDTLADLPTRQAALLALKDQLAEELTEGAVMVMNYGTFRQRVRVGKFTAKVNQPMNYIEWNLTGTFTRFPDEADYLSAEWRVTHKERMEEGIDYLTLAGKFLAPSETAARTALGLLQGAIVPEGYIQEDEETTATFVNTQSDATANGAKAPAVSSDGVFVELSFSLAFRDTTTLAVSYQRTGDNNPVVDLGTVMKMSDHYTATLFDELRSHRKRAAGMVTLSGQIFRPDTEALLTKQAKLEEIYATIMSELVTGKDGVLKYGTPGAEIFNGTVRIVDFHPEFDRAQNQIKWSLSGSYTRYPDEADYALCEFNFGPAQEDKVTGIVRRHLTGRIGAPTAALALAKLQRLRLALVPADSGFILVSEDSQQRQVSVESDKSGDDNSDGDTFIELTLNDVWQLAAGGILTWQLKTVDDDDTRSGWVHSTFSGSVQASAADRATAFAAATAQAETLGGDKYDFLLRSSVAEDDRLFQTSGGKVFVTVEFSYEYLRKGEATFLEVRSELTVETFGRTVERVSGTVAGPTLAACNSAYQTQVRNLPAYASALILNERTPTLAQVSLLQTGFEPATLDDVFHFSFEVHRAKDASETAMRYSTATDRDIQSNETRTTVSGQVWAADEATANAFLDTFFGGLALGGSVVNVKRTAQYESGTLVDGAASGQVFVSLEFSQVFVALYGFNGILSTEVSEQYEYAGTRWVVQNIPDGISIVQNCGVKCGSHTVTARAVGTVESAARAYVQTLRALITGPYQHAPSVKTEWKFLDQVLGVPRGGGANPKLCVVEAVFSELVPATVYNG